MMFNIWGQILLGVFILSASFTASAFEKEPFTKERFAELQAEDHVVIVDVYASWCPTCESQQVIFKRYSKLHPENKFHVLIIDYDKQKDLVAEYGAPRQATLYLFKGKERLWSAVAARKYRVISKALDSAFEMEETQVKVEVKAKPKKRFWIF